MKIRRLDEHDLLARVEWINNPAVYSNMHFELPVTLEKTKEWFNNNKDSEHRADVVFEDEDNNLVGMGGFTSINANTGFAELYIFLNPKFQNKGKGKKATTLLCQYGFKELGLKKIYLYTNQSNIPAQKVYEKVGFKLEGRFRNENVKNIESEDRLYYGMFPEELIDGKKESYDELNLEIILNKVQIDETIVNVVRDDIFPAIGGGVKARKILYYEKYMKDNGYDSCVTTGGIQSNHNRAVALMCARNNWTCHVVYHGSKDRFEKEKGNALIVKKSGTSVEFVEANEIGSAMDTAMNLFKEKGLTPLYIHGGGHDLPGGIALVEAVKELKRICDIQGYKPKYIFHASGTGSTQAGIAVGLDLVGWQDVKLIGISVARQKERGTKVIEEFANDLANYCGLDKDYTGKINFNTDYLCGGYEKYSSDMEIYLDEIMRNTGIMFDTTYSGKALWGMMDYCKRNKISDGIIFWHTGGLMNLMK